MINPNEIRVHNLTADQQSLVDRICRAVDDGQAALVGGHLERYADELAALTADELRQVGDDLQVVALMLLADRR